MIMNMMICQEIRGFLHYNDTQKRTDHGSYEL